MKTLLLVSLLSSIAAADNCYIHERGSESWYNCKDEAAHDEKRADELRQDMRDLRNQEAADSTARMQAEQISNAVQNAEFERQRQEIERKGNNDAN